MMRNVRSNHAAAVGRDDPIAPNAAAPWPKVWLEEKRLEDACLLIADCPHTTAPDEGIGYPLVRTPNIGEGRLVFEKMHRVSRTVYEARNKRAKPQAGDLIYAREAPAGNVALITEGQEVCLGQRTVLLRPNPSIVDSAYLTYYLLSPEQKHRLLDTASGATVQHVNIPEIRNLKISLPPLSIQQRIASVLGAYDDLIENNRRRIALLEKMARELYRERFVRRSGKGNAVTLGEIMSITRGLSYTSREIDTADGVNLINLKNIRSFGGFREEGTKKYSGDYKNAQVVKKGDLVMGVTDMTQDRRTVGAVALLPDLEGESVISADLIKIDSELGNCFLFCMFCYGGVSSQIGQFATGATVLHLRPQAVLDFSVTLPACEEVEAFESQIVPIFEEQGNLLSQNRSLARQRDRLLPRLMSGKIDVEAFVKEEERHG